MCLTNQTTVTSRAVGDVAAVFENDDERDLHAARVGGRFYQTALDEMMACNPEDMDVVTPRINREAASVSNPDGYDFQALAGRPRG